MQTPASFKAEISRLNGLLQNRTAERDELQDAAKKNTARIAFLEKTIRWYLPLIMGLPSTLANYLQTSFDNVVMGPDGMCVVINTPLAVIMIRPATDSYPVIQVRSAINEAMVREYDVVDGTLSQTDQDNLLGFFQVLDRIGMQGDDAVTAMDAVQLPAGNAVT